MLEKENFDAIAIKAIHEGILYLKRDCLIQVKGDSHIYPYVAYNGAYLEIRYDDHTDYLAMDDYGSKWFLASDQVVL